MGTHKVRELRERLVEIRHSFPKDSPDLHTTNQMICVVDRWLQETDELRDESIRADHEE